MRRLSAILAVLAVGFLFLGYLGLVRSRERVVLDVHPVRHGGIWSYDDREAGGRSRSDVRRIGTRILWSWRLDSGVTWPYLGVSFTPPEEARVLDVSSFDSLEIDWNSRHGAPVRILCMLDVPGFTDSARPLTRLYRAIEISPPLDSSRTAWDLARFDTPPWWFRTHKLSRDSSPVRWDRLLDVAIEQGESVAPGLGDTLEIRSIRFLRRGRSPLGGFLVLLLGAVLLAVSGALWRFRAMGESVPASPPPAPLEVPPGRGEKVTAWLQANYQRPDLTLEPMARELGMGGDTVSQEVRRAFGKPFKAALNGLRLEEARRLLHATDLGIAEIAFKVGYGSVPHFNRLFREHWGHTPTEEREAFRKASSEL